MNTKELRDKIGNSSFNAIIKHPYYKEHLYTSHHDPVFHHETTPSGSHSTIRAEVPFGGKKKTITFQYHKNKVYNAHYALDGKHIRSHKEVKESMELNELSATLIQSYLNKLKAKKRAEQEKKEPVTEAKIGDKVQVTHGSQKGLVGHVGEIRKGLGGQDHTYTVDYDDNGNRQSVQVKKAHTKIVKEESEDITEAPSIYSSSMARGSSGMRAKAPNASDKPDFGTYNVTVKHEGGEKTYKLKNMKEPKHAMNTAQKIHRKDNPEHKIKDVTYEKLSEESIVEVSKKVLGRYIEKAATSMSAAAFGQGQASASRRPPSEEDQKTGMKRMTGIARATSKLTKEEAEQVDELKKSTLTNYLDKAVDPIHGMPRSPEKLPQRMKGIASATKKILKKEVNEAAKPAKPSIPHIVSVQLKHPDMEGVTRKIVKINATGANNAIQAVEKHYGASGFSIHKIDYSKPHKMTPPKSAEEKQAEQDKKEDNKVKKIAKAVKDAIK